MRPDECGTGRAYPPEETPDEDRHDSHPARNPGRPGARRPAAGGDGAVPRILTRHAGPGLWWSRWDTDCHIWARGTRAAEADAVLRELVPWPPRCGDEIAEVLTAEEDGRCFAAYAADPRVVAEGETVEAAVFLLAAFVPEPRDRGGVLDSVPPPE